MTLYNVEGQEDDQISFKSLLWLRRRCQLLVSCVHVLLLCYLEWSDEWNYGL